MPRASTGPDLINLQIKEFKKRKIKFLFDTGATVTFVKLRNLRGETLIYENKITLAGVIGHEIAVIGKITATILLNEHQVQRIHNCR